MTHTIKEKKDFLASRCFTQKELDRTLAMAEISPMKAALASLDKHLTDRKEKACTFYGITFTKEQESVAKSLDEMIGLLADAIAAIKDNLDELETKVLFPTYDKD